MFRKLPSKLSALLQEIIASENAVSMLQERIESSSAKDEAILRGALGELDDCGYISVLWADNTVCVLAINGSGYTYAEREAEYDRQQNSVHTPTYSINASQVNIANDSSVINASQNIGIDQQQLQDLIACIKKAITPEMSEDDTVAVVESIEVIEDQLMLSNPKKSFIKTALATLRAIKGTAEFGAAVIALIQFVQPLIH